eukprot:TRINITY_DN2509_c0_g1_i1.p1 TRINITY_DN2509_c0_g1~~TRINITY_DN2509_c0_g1_i1.p1  ORF type:complete len:193 (-),score=52.48 TRINITY_DN2509_c0_g1_i1:154-732(-)
MGLTELFRFEKPLESGLVLLSFNAVYIANVLQGSSLLGALFSFLLFFVVLSFLVIRLSAFLYPNIKAALDQVPANGEEKYLFITPDTIEYYLFNAIKNLQNFFNKATSQDVDLFFLIKFLVVSFLIHIISRVFNLLTIIWLVFNALFIYFRFREQIHSLAAPLTTITSNLSKTAEVGLKSFVPKYSDLKKSS